MSSIVPIVEGDGDREAAPVLLRKVLQEQYQRYDISILQPVNARGKSTLLRDGQLEKYLEYAALRPGCEAILILLDTDDDCPRDLAGQLKQRSRALGLDKPIAIVCAKQEYEAWFLASVETIRGQRGISSAASFEGLVEDVKGVKEWLTWQMPQGRAYNETLDQAPLSQAIDLDLARQSSRSFRRLCHAVGELIQAMDEGLIRVTPLGA
jgi:hypothetical protein